MFETIPSFRDLEFPRVPSLSPPSLFVVELARTLLQRAKNLLHADDLAICSSSSNPSKAEKLSIKGRVHCFSIFNPSVQTTLSEEVRMKKASNRVRAINVRAGEVFIWIGFSKIWECGAQHLELLGTEGLWFMHGADRSPGRSFLQPGMD